MSTATTIPARTAPPELSLTRLHLLRGGYALMGGGLALVKWPLLPDAHAMPLYEGVTLVLLTAASLLALLGLRYPVKLLPLLVFETVWKLLWLGLVALPNAMAGDLSAAMSEVVFRCAWDVFIIAVIPWRYVWTQYVRTDGDPWRR
jgi:hypothetical protein